MEISPRVKGPGYHEWRSHEWCPGPFTSGEISIYSSGAHTSSSFSYIICIFTQKVSAFDQQCVNGNLHTAALCWNMHILYENVPLAYGRRGGNGYFTTSDGARTPRVAKPRVVSWPHHEWWNFHFWLWSPYVIVILAYHMHIPPKCYSFWPGVGKWKFHHCCFVL